MTEATRLPALIGRKYKPLRLIARGGMGAVYEVVHANTGDHLALKLMLARSLLSPEMVERFRREARIQSSVKSEHVVRVVDADVAPELDGAPFLVMELLSGQDFERICAARQPSPAEVVDWLGQVARALDRAHRERIVHRDLKPENLFLAEREDLPPIVKILDFGVAKMAGETDGGSTATGQILGTPRYMAPEQAAGAKQVSAAADRFALGLIAFRLLGGRHYFDGDNWAALLRDVAHGPASRPSEMGCDRGAAFDAWFARACALEPAERFPSCAEQLDALGKALAGISLVARPRRAASSRRRLLGWAMVVGASCIGIGTTVWTLARHGRAPASLARTPPMVEPAPPSPPPGVPVEVPPAFAQRSPSVSAPDPQLLGASPASQVPGARRRRTAHIATAPAPNVEPARDRVWDEP
jgi:serine/threonine protein kinase